METAGSPNLLIKKAKNGDIGAFENLIIENEKIVYNIALRMMGNNIEDAKDISQDVFIKAFKNISRFDEKSSFKTWLYRITVNTCIDEIRKRKGKQVISIDAEFETDENSIKHELPDNSPTPENVILKNERQAYVFDAINRLSDEHKSVVVLKDIEGFSYQEISDITKVSLGTVKSRLARARLQLKNSLKESMELFPINNRHND